MEFVVNDNIKIWKKYNPIELYCQPMTDDIAIALFENQTRIFIKEQWFDVISLSGKGAYGTVLQVKLKDPNSELENKNKTKDK